MFYTPEIRQKIKDLAGKKTITEIAIEIDGIPNSVRRYCVDRGLPIKKAEKGISWVKKATVKKRETNIVRPPAVYNNQSAAEYWASIDI